MTGYDAPPAPLGPGGGSDSRLGPLTELLKLGNTPKSTGLSDGVQAAHEFAPDIWKETALAAVRYLASTGSPFSVDDLRRLGVDEPDKPQRWGSLLAVVKNDGGIVRIGMREHRTRKGDGNLVRLWKGTGGRAEEAA